MIVSKIANQRHLDNQLFASLPKKSDIWENISSRNRVGIPAALTISDNP
jgi:hypothetical protein